MAMDATTTQEKNPAASWEDGCGLLVIGKKFDWLTRTITGELVYAIMTTEEGDRLVTWGLLLKKH